ncbi:hypothetical protein [Demequina activiva]|nr:hypothetical protein [Demequina activiva]
MTALTGDVQGSLPCAGGPDGTVAMDVDGASFSMVGPRSEATGVVVP